MQSQTKTLRLLLLTTLTILTTTTTAFSGVGQLRTRQWDEDHPDLGCVTDAGLWSGNDAECGVFVASPAAEDGSLFTLASTAGNCRVVGASFSCGEGVDAFEFGTWPKDWPNGIPGIPVLRWGQYGLMASDEPSSPGLTGQPQVLHLVSYTEKGKRVWLTWKDIE